MNIVDAAHRVGHEAPGGVASLAPRMGMKEAVLNSKINPNTHTHHLTINEMVRMEQLTGRRDMLIAHAEALGCVAIPVPNVEDGDIAQMMPRTPLSKGFARALSCARNHDSATPQPVRGSSLGFPTAGNSHPGIALGFGSGA